jgi:O-antigen ligase/polysaccharide polymerase Wzy-like membrane protein
VTSRLSGYALAALVVGLALHNLVLAELWDAGLRGRGLDVVAAWKEALLAVALAAALWQARRIPLATADALAFVYAGIVVVYAVVPQHWLGGAATTKGVLYALRHDLVPVAAYVLGRLAAVGARDRHRIAWLAVGVGAALSVWGLVDVYLVPLQWWRDSGVPGWFREQLSLDSKGLSGLPENWVYNTGDETHPIRRLVATFLSPLASAYLLVVVLLFLSARERFSRWTALAAAVCFAGLLWTHTRAATLALAAGLVLLAAAQKRWLPLGLAAAVVVVSVGFFAAYKTIGPSTSYTSSELAYLHENAQAHPGAGGDPFSAGDTSLASHWRNLRRGVDTVVHHPQGYGLGNAGTEARRTGVAPLAGESTYTQLGVEAGLAGLVAFAGWCAALTKALWSRSAWLFAAFGAVLLLALQTDVLGVHWLAYVVFALCGAALGPTGRAVGEELRDPA